MMVARFSSIFVPAALNMVTVKNMTALTPDHCWKNMRLREIRRGRTTDRWMKGEAVTCWSSSVLVELGAVFSLSAESSEL